MTLTLPGPGLALSDNVERPKLDVSSVSATAFVGNLQSNFPFKVIKIDSWTAYRGYFGDNSHHVARAVFGFFDNGGQEAFVVDTGESAHDSESALYERWQEVTESLDCEDQISLIVAPGESNPVAIEILEQHCAERKDRLLLLDGEAESIDTENLPDSKFVAIYHPWIEMMDPISGEKVTQPPAGHIAGVFARTEAQRGIHTAPANAKIHGALSLSRRFSRRRRERLFQQNINLLRDDSNRGGAVRVFGAKIHTEDSQWQSIMIRRVTMMISKAVSLGTQWVVHERNDEQLWHAVTEQLNEFFEELRVAGLLAGDSASDAYYVKCDAEFNPVEKIGGDQVIFEVGFCPLKPRQFNIVRFCQWPGGMEIAE